LYQTLLLDSSIFPLLLRLDEGLPAISSRPRIAWRGTCAILEANGRRPQDGDQVKNPGGDVRNQADVRKAIDDVQDRLGIDRLLISPKLKAGTGRMFLDLYSELIELPMSGQIVIRSAFEHHLEAVVHDPRGVPVKLYPWMPDPLGKRRTTIMIDPELSFGAPVTAHRRISMAVLTDLGPHRGVAIRVRAGNEEVCFRDR
jgi:hypothetical protein